MRKARMILLITPVFLFIIAILASYSGITHDWIPSRERVRVPDDIIQDLLAHTDLSNYGDRLSDLEWEVYSEDESRRIVGATFRVKGSEDQSTGWYCLMVYTPRTRGMLAERVYGAFATIDDADFNVSGFSVYDVSSPAGISATRTLVTTGLATDEKVARVVLETSAGRTVEATMYERFWLLASPAAGATERVTKAVGYAEDGTRLHLHYVFPKDQPAQALPLKAKVEAGLRDSDPLIREAWSMIQTSIDDSEEESRRIFAEEATRFTDAR